MVQKKRYKSILENFEKKTGEDKINSTINMQNWGNFFTSMAVIGGKIYSNHHKNMNHVNKDSKYLVSVIITMGKNITGGETVFYYGVKTSNLGSRANILKKLHGRMIFGPFEFFSRR